MRQVQSIPFLRIIVPFLIGILIYKIEDSLSPFTFLAILGITFLGIFIFNKVAIEERLSISWVKGILLNALLIAVGFFIAFFHNIENNNSWYKNHTTPDCALEARILTPLKETPKTYKTTAEIIRVYNDTCKNLTLGKAILYFKKGDSLPTLRVRDQIVFVNKLNPIISKGNPGEFDYAAFSKNRGIYEQAFLTKNEWKNLNLHKSNFQHPFDAIHESIKGVISDNIPDSAAKGIALALITGYRDDIDKQVYTQYTKTGLVHLLAISGLHMGIFYYGTLGMLGLFPFFKKRKKTLIIISLLVMWLFALVTTFPPSVQRASVMFTFLGIGQLINRKIPSVNFLFASAFFLLLFQPHLLFEVGFQLSYAAVLSILLFFKSIRNWYFPKNRITKFFWEIMCLSLSAQIFTFPIAIYYFHQLPLLFLITNLVAIPLVTLIIYGEVLMIIVALFSPWLVATIGKLVTAIIKFLNGFIEQTASLSFVSIQNININPTQCILLIALMLCLAGWFLAKRKIFAPLALVFLITFVSISIFQKSKQLQQNKLVVYNTNTPYLELLTGNNFYTNDTITQGQISSFIQYTRQPSHLHFGITKPFLEEPVWVSNGQYDYLNVNKTSVLRIRKEYKLKIDAPVEVDYLILSDKWIKDAPSILTNISAKEIIIDGNIPLWKIDDIKSQFSEVDLPLHFVATDGAKIISL